MRADPGARCRGSRDFPHHRTYADFRESFYHAVRHQDLYAHYAVQGTDLFKYSPAFARLFTPFALPPVES